MQAGPSAFSKAASDAYKSLPPEERDQFKGTERTKLTDVRREAKKIFTRIGKEV